MVAKKTREAMERASWIRRMFEEGARLKQERGEDRVFDFSLGNPCLEPPSAYLEAQRDLLREGVPPGGYGYMPNAGYPETRATVASRLQAKRGIPIEARHIVMTCGAAGGLNVVFKTVLDPGDEVLILSPFFSEYLFYVDNHGGIPRIVETPEDFSLPLDAIEQAVSSRTRAILVNSPNNPTGRMYDEASLQELVRVLDEASARLKRRIYLISDEPYGEIVFDGRTLPDLFSLSRSTILVNSFSKSLSIAGERLGYIAVHPEIEEEEALVDGLIFSNRILGFVNAPATAQRTIQRAPESQETAQAYEARRDLICKGLEEAGYRFLKPEGAFYLFPQSPVQDEIPFVQDLFEEGILVVPGRGFGRSGYFRIAYCVDPEVIEKALPGFTRVRSRYPLGP